MDRFNLALSRFVIAFSWAILYITPSDYPNRAWFLDHLRDLIQERFNRTGALQDLNQAINACEEAVSLTSETTHRATYMHRLGLLLQTRFERTRNREDLNRAIATIEEVVDSTSSSHPDRTTYLNSLCLSLLSRFELAGSTADINDGLAAIEKVLELTPEDHSDRASYMNTLGHLLIKRFEQTGMTQDLERVIAAHEEVLANSNPGDRVSQIDYLGVLAISLQLRYDLTGTVEDLDRAIVLDEEAQGLASRHGLSEHVYSNNLCVSLRKRFERTGGKDDLNRSITVLTHSLDFLPKDSMNRARYLCHLGTSLKLRFEAEGSIEDLNRAIALNQEAIDLTLEGHPYRSVWLNNIGNALEARFDHIGLVDDLNAAIVAKEAALNSTVHGHPYRAMYLKNLGTALVKRSVRIRSIEDLDRGIRLEEEAVALTPVEHANYARYLNSLGVSYQERFSYLGSSENLDKAIAKLERAIQLAPSDYLSRALSLSNLSIALRLRFEHNPEKTLRDLNDAIAKQDEAIGIIAKDNPYLADFHVHLATLFRGKRERTGALEDFNKAISSGEMVISYSFASPRLRIAAILEMTSLLQSSDVLRTSRLLKTAVELLPTTSNRALSRRDHQFNIARYSGHRISSFAAAMALQAGDSAAEALRLFELGRGFLSSLQLDARTDITTLGEWHPEIAENFKRLRDEFDVSVINDKYSVRDGVSFPLSVINRRHAIASEFNSAVQTIRNLKGFERFLLGPSHDDLIDLASHGPIVILNVAPNGSHAFLVTSQKITSLALPELRSADEEKAQIFLEAVRKINTANYHRVNKEVRMVLEWLWDSIVGPVLEELGFTETPGENSIWPHVWWVPSGWLSLLPIHAAGYHNDNLCRSALDRVVSSYTMTLKALAFARERATRATSQRTPEVLFVSMLTTPSQGDLPHVVKEVADLSDLIPPSIEKHVLSEPTKDDVLLKLRTSSIAHFACHGRNYPFDPSQSSLLLSDWNVNPLTVSDIVALKPEYSQLAYLSTCHAASNYTRELFDEGIHLAGAFQLAGFSQVIGTLWQIDDELSVLVSQGVYRAMLHDFGGIDIGKSAQGLHRAVRRLRNEETIALPGFTRRRRLLSEPLVWAQYIHIGA